MAWELEFLKIMNRDFSLVKVAYQAQQSIDNELNRVTSTDVLTVLTLYVVMFIYTALSRSETRSTRSTGGRRLSCRASSLPPAAFFVLLSVFMAVGFFSWINVEASLIITEVIPFFLKEEINEPVCGVNGQSSNPDVVWQNGREGTLIQASRLRLYHTVLVTQDDIISAMETSFNMSDNFNALTTFETFPYSDNYVYFQHYFDIIDVCVMDIIYALSAVFLVVMILMFDPVIAAIIVLCVSMSVIDLVGVMYLWNIKLNAVSSVNLVMSIGFTIEFCVHLEHLVETSKETTLNGKMYDAVTNMGNNVFVAPR